MTSFALLGRAWPQRPHRCGKPIQTRKTRLGVPTVSQRLFARSRSHLLVKLHVHRNKYAMNTRAAVSGGGSAGSAARGGGVTKQPERNSNQSQTPHGAFHYDDNSKRRVFEGWYIRITLPQDKASFAFIHEVEDPTGGTPFSKINSQVMGPGRGYIMQHTRDISSFWGDSTQMAFGGCYSPADPQKARQLPRGMVTPDEFDELVLQGFQASDSWHQGSLSPSEPDGEMTDPQHNQGATASTVPYARWGYELKPVYGWGDSVVTHPGTVSAAEPQSGVSSSSGESSDEKIGYSSSSSGGEDGDGNGVGAVHLQAGKDDEAGGSRGNGNGRPEGKGIEGNGNGWEKGVEAWERATGVGSVKGNQGQQATTGWLPISPLFDPQWQICVAHALATGWVEWGEERYEFSNVPAYIEKNWGSGFPKKWFWIQCNSFQDHPDLTITAVGANRRTVQPYGGYADVGVIGIHWRGVFIEMVPWNSSMSWEVEPWGTWKMVGENHKYKVEVVASTDDEGTMLRGPHEDLGFIPNCKDSFEGTIHLKIWRKRKDVDGMITPMAASLPGLHLASEELVLDATTYLAAVESGGGPWDGTWASSCNVPDLVKTALKQPLDTDRIRRDTGVQQ